MIREAEERDLLPLLELYLQREVFPGYEEENT